MAVTYPKPTYSVVEGANRVITIDATLDNAYPAGGYPLAAANLGARKGGRVLHVFDTITDGGFVVHFVPSTSKLKIFKVGAAGALTEVSGADVNGQKVRLRAVVKN